MDRKQLTGLLLIFAILAGYYIYFDTFAPSAPPQERGSEAPMDSIAVAPGLATTEEEVAPAVPDSAETARRYGSFAAAMRGEAREVTLENEDLRVVLNSRGGGISAVELRDFKTYEGQPLRLLDADAQTRSLLLPTATGSVDLAKLYFTTDAPAEVRVTPGDTQRVSFTLQTAAGTVEQTYLIPGSGYEIGYRLRVRGFDGEALRYDWTNQLPNVEKDIQQSRIMAGVTYYSDEEGFDDLVGRTDELETADVDEGLRWFGFKNKFFTTALIADGQPFQGGKLTSRVPSESETVVKSVSASVALPLAAAQTDGGAAFRYYFGPNDYRVLNRVTDGFEENVDLGWLVFAWINKFIINNLFELLEGFIGNYGVVIIILVLVIKTALFPLSFRSYLSAAKMKALKPELDALKAEHGDDMQKIQQEQMKLYQQVGVNPVAGCIPLVLQMPFLLAMFYFFPNAIHLRQEAFLWAEDLSTYDSILNLPFSIPFGYGAHVSLFTLLMTASQIAYTHYNNQMTTTAMQGPMQSITYFMPLIFMFVLNSYPAGLSFYYLVSNVITIGQQIVARHLIDEEAVRAKLLKNKEQRKTKKKSKFQQRLEAAMDASEQQKQKQEARQNGRGARSKNRR
ncbi:MAG: membrane protein insertase YidC [Catalinimonas sp.]